MTSIAELNIQLADTPYTLIETEEGLALDVPKMKPVRVDFHSDRLMHRQKRGGGFSELLAKAVLAKTHPQVLDLTAGLGQDAYVLAELACEVTMVERNAVVYALLLDGLNRLKIDEPDIGLDLIFGDSKDYLQALTPEHYPDVIYIDPMHPIRKKSALVKKEMRVLRELLGHDEDKDELFKLALNKVNKRVVVKWPLNETPIANMKPAHSYKGRSTRFDVFPKLVEQP